MCRELVDAPPGFGEQQQPVRIFAGNGMRRDVPRSGCTRFKVGVLEFYASTEGNAVLANASGEKVSALGQPLPGATDMSIVVRTSATTTSFATKQAACSAARWTRGHAHRARRSRPPDGRLRRLRQRLETRERDRGGRRGRRPLVRLGDLLRQDADGDWFVDG
ncbi:MAG: hypothetical protein R3B82_25355 [Sandaracinaceae bacterium]